VDDAPSRPGTGFTAAGAPGKDEEVLPSGLPSRTSFLLAFLSVVVAGLFGGIIGFGLVDVGCTGDCSGSKLLGTILGAAVGAVGVGVVAVLVLRAMAEWKRRPPS
jgi:hypothetical protein